jgi:crotonobetainyl-CoA:carnitine CoA-transferase CaiB-like acyl-CoA transferase
VPSLLADKTAGLHTVYAVLAALYHRERTGAGQHIEIPMFEVMVSFNLAEHLYGHVHQPPSGQWGYTRVLTPNRRPFRTRDGYIAIMPYRDEHWPRFFELAGHPDKWSRWRHASFQDRTRHIDELYALVGSVTSDRTTDEWMGLLGDANIPCMRVNRLEDLPDDPHLQQVGLFESRDHPTEGPYRSIRHPVQFGAHDTPVRHEPPRYGGDSRALLEELGLESSEVDELVASGTVREPDA